MPHARYRFVSCLPLSGKAPYQSAALWQRKEGKQSSGAYPVQQRDQINLLGSSSTRRRRSRPMQNWHIKVCRVCSCIPPFQTRWKADTLVVVVFFVECIIITMRRAGGVRFERKYCSEGVGPYHEIPRTPFVLCYVNWQLLLCSLVMIDSCEGCLWCLCSVPEIKIIVGVLLAGETAFLAHIFVTV